MKLFFNILLFVLSFHKIFTSSCKETFEEDDQDYLIYRYSYYDGSRSREETIESATMTCVNITLLDGLSLPPMYVHTPQNYEQILNISQSNVVSIPKGAFSKFHSISKLYLKKIRTLSIAPGAFENLTKLRELYLNDNFQMNLTSEVFNPLPSLEVLDLSNNILFQLHKSAFRGIENLKILNLRDNLLTELEDGLFADLQFLESLDLTHNHFHKFHIGAFLKENKWALDKLVTLEYSKCGFAIFNVNLSDTSIQFLNLSLNTLESFDFSRIPSDIDQIDLSGNSISTFTNPEMLQATDVYLDYNKINRLNGTFGKNTQLHFSHNEIESLEGSIFVNSENLRFVNLSCNRISKIDKEVFADLINLEELYLDHNNLTEIIPGMFRNMGKLKNLDLSHNQIDKFQFGIFETLTSLQILDLSGNEISKLEQQVFYSLSFLETLRLNNNQISSIDVQALVVHCVNLKTVSLDQNPWTCKNLAQAHHIFRIHNIDVEKGNSFDVENFHGIECSNPKEVDRSSFNSSDISKEELYKEFQKAVNKGVQASNLNSFFNVEFKDSKFFQYFNKGGGENSSSKISSGENSTSDNNVIIAVNIVQIVLSVLLLFTICFTFYRLRSSKLNSSDYSSQTQLYYKP